MRKKETLTELEYKTLKEEGYTFIEFFNQKTGNKK